jgi:hypothetical protein
VSDRAGGGVWNDGTVQNCVIAGNTGMLTGGCYAGDGLTSGQFINCIISNNVAPNVNNGPFGWSTGVGGVVGAALYNCLIVNNQGNQAAACDLSCTLNNCTLSGNVSTNCTLQNCGLVNCIVYYNTNYIIPNARQIATNCTVSYTCATPLAAGSGNFTNAPIFVSASNFRLGPHSPCVDTGTDVVPGVFTDLDGQPRFFRTIDLGCYERQIPGDLNNDGIVDANDLNILLTNYSSAVDQAAVSVVLSNYWPNRLLLNMTNVVGLGSTNITFALTNSNAGAYSVQYSTDLNAWQTLGPAIPCYTFTDTNAVPGQQRFYRLSFP